MTISQLSDVIGQDCADEVARRYTRAITDWYSEALISRRSLRFDAITPLSRYVVDFRMRRAAQLAEWCARNNREPYPVLIWEESHACRLILPPVVESSPGQQNILIDGTHRCLAAMQQGSASVAVIHVEMPTHRPLPSEPSSWEAIVSLPEQQPIEIILESYNPAYFRPATTFFNSDEFVFSSKAEMIDRCVALITS